MTKKGMILEIQKMEVSAWKELKTCEHFYGKEDDITSRKRVEWSTIHRTMQDLEIKSMPISQQLDEGYLPIF